MNGNGPIGSQGLALLEGVAFFVVGIALLGGSMSLGVGFEVSDAQVSLVLPAAYQLRSRTLSSSSTMHLLAMITMD